MSMMQKEDGRFRDGDHIEAVEGVNKSTLRTRMKRHTPPNLETSSKNGGGEIREVGTT